MDARRWDQVRAVFDEVVEVGDAERGNRLTMIGTTDPRLRKAVENLLKADTDADAWLAIVEAPLGLIEDSKARGSEERASEPHARIQSALRGAYHVERELGGGGMSRVFVAEETAFRRLVVIKVLRSDFVETISAKRFQREIEFAARLQHPHIVPLLSAGEADGLLYYTMPYIDGESLRERLRREGELPIDDTVRILGDVASALAYAHRHGVVHRDIKPENVLLSDGGAVVADFGIAKALRASRARGNEALATSRITEQGVALGTPLYMAPEQAADDSTTDHRADLYALGALAYEMLAGRPPFEGRSSQQLMAAHAAERPEAVATRRASTPPALAALVMRCLEKRPADRPQSAEQILAVLDKPAHMRASVAGDASGSGPAFTLPRLRVNRTVAWAVLAAIAVGVASAAVARWPGDRRTQTVRFDLVLPDSAPTLAEDPAIALSPDGSVVAYIGGSRRSLFIRPLDQLLPRRLEGTDGARSLDFSPDGRWLAFISKSRLKKVNLRGGSPITLVDSADDGAAWTDRNEIVFDWRSALYRVSSDGGTVSLLAAMDISKTTGLMIPSHALPGGKAALLCLSPDAASRWQIGLVTLPGGRITQLTAGGFSRCPARYANGYLVFTQNRALIARPFSLSALRFTGPEVVLLRDSIAGFSTAANGTLAYTSGVAPTFSLVAVSEGGRTRTLAGNVEEARQRGSPLMPLDTGRYQWPRLSPDGKRVVVEGLRPFDIWVYDIESRALSRLTSNSTGLQPVGWSRDGRNVIYVEVASNSISGPRRIVSQPWDGTAPPREVLRLPARFLQSIHTIFDVTVGPAHGYAAFVADGFLSDSADIWIAPLDTPSAVRPLMVTKAREFQPRISPNGTLLAYISNETGKDEVYIRSLVGRSRRVQISTHGGWQPLWSADGRGLYYRAPGYVMRARVSNADDLRIVGRDTLFKDTFNQWNVVNYDVFPGGKELLMIRTNPPGPAHTTVVLNWPDLLRSTRP